MLTATTVYKNFNDNTEARAQYSRRKMTRNANGRIVYEPRLSLQPVTNNTFTTSYVLRVNGAIMGSTPYKCREDAVRELRRLARFWWRGEAGTPANGEF